jgi:hypothetical protein
LEIFPPPEVKTMSIKQQKKSNHKQMGATSPMLFEDSYVEQPFASKPMLLSGPFTVNPNLTEVYNLMPSLIILNPRAIALMSYLAYMVQYLDHARQNLDAGVSNSVAWKEKSGKDGPSPGKSATFLRYAFKVTRK